jgi:hypothetical protein
MSPIQNVTSNHPSNTTYLILSNVTRTYDLNGLKTPLATNNGTMSQVFLQVFFVISGDSLKSLHLTSH